MVMYQAEREISFSLGNAHPKPRCHYNQMKSSFSQPPDMGSAHMSTNSTLITTPRAVKRFGTAQVLIIQCWTVRGKTTISDVELSRRSLQFTEAFNGAF